MWVRDSAREKIILPDGWAVVIPPLWLLVFFRVIRAFQQNPGDPCCWGTDAIPVGIRGSRSSCRAAMAHPGRRPFLHAAWRMLPRDINGHAGTAGRKGVNRVMKSLLGQSVPPSPLPPWRAVALPLLPWWAGGFSAANAEISTPHNCSSVPDAHARPRTCRTGLHSLRARADAGPQNDAAFRQGRATVLDRLQMPPGPLDEEPQELPADDAKGPHATAGRVQWPFVRGALEEVLTGEVLTRVWTAVLCLYDRRRGAAASSSRWPAASCSDTWKPGIACWRCWSARRASIRRAPWSWTTSAAAPSAGRTCSSDIWPALATWPSSPFTGSGRLNSRGTSITNRARRAGGRCGRCCRPRSARRFGADWRRSVPMKTSTPGSAPPFSLVFPASCSIPRASSARSGCTAWRTSPATSRAWSTRWWAAGRWEWRSGWGGLEGEKDEGWGIKDQGWIIVRNCLAEWSNEPRMTRMGADKRIKGEQIQADVNFSKKHPLPSVSSAVHFIWLKSNHPAWTHPSPFILLSVLQRGLEFQRPGGEHALARPQRLRGRGLLPSCPAARSPILCRGHAADIGRSLEAVGYLHAAHRENWFFRIALHEDDRVLAVLHHGADRHFHDILRRRQFHGGRDELPGPQQPARIGNVAADDGRVLVGIDQVSDVIDKAGDRLGAHRGHRPLIWFCVRAFKSCKAGKSSSGTEASTIRGSTLAIWKRLVVLSTTVSCRATFCSMMKPSSGAFNSTRAHCFNRSFALARRSFSLESSWLRRGRPGFPPPGFPRSSACSRPGWRRWCRPARCAWRWTGRPPARPPSRPRPAWAPLCRAAIARGRRRGRFSCCPGRRCRAPPAGRPSSPGRRPAVRGARAEYSRRGVRIVDLADLHDFSRRETDADANQAGRIEGRRARHRQGPLAARRLGDAICSAPPLTNAQRLCTSSGTRGFRLAVHHCDARQLLGGRTWFRPEEASKAVFPRQTPSKQTRSGLPPAAARLFPLGEIGSRPHGPGLPAPAGAGNRRASGARPRRKWAFCTLRDGIAK